MIEMRWTKLPEDAAPAGFSMDGQKLVLQYRYRLPVHPGFRMSSDPVTGQPVDSDQWSEWQTVDLPDPPDEEVL